MVKDSNRAYATTLGYRFPVIKIISLRAKDEFSATMALGETISRNALVRKCLEMFLFLTPVYRKKPLQCNDIFLSQLRINVSVLLFPLQCASLFFLSLLFNIAVCPDPGHLTNGIRLGKNFKNGSTVTFKCNANHDLIGNDTIRCEDKVWSGDVPICKGAMQCEMF